MKAGSALWGITVQTFKVTIRSKWLIMFAIVFFFFSFNLPFLSLGSLLSTIPAKNVPNFIQVVITTSFSLMPLLALPIGAVSIVEERESGSLAFILSTPTSRGKFLFARFCGLLAATTFIIVLGFTFAALVAFRLSTGTTQMWYVTEAAVLLNAAMVSVSLVISSLSRKRLTAYGGAIFLWFLFSYAGDTTVTAPILVAANQYWVLLPSILLNPIEVSRLIALFSMNVVTGGPLAITSSDIGSTGQALINIFGMPGAVEALWVTMGMWMSIMLASAYFILTFQDIR